MSLPTSDRTILRDAIVAEFNARKGTDAMRLQNFEVATNYLAAEEADKSAVTYCVVIADESPSPSTMQQDNFSMTVILVIYVRDETDVRAVLDAAIEDAYASVLAVQGKVKGTSWKLKMDDMTTDDGTTVAKPRAQAVQRWMATHTRSAVAA